MKKIIALFFAFCMVASISSCKKTCKCTLLKNGVPVENAQEFERDLDKAYSDCSYMGDYDEATQTGIQCK